MAQSYNKSIRTQPLTGRIKDIALSKEASEKSREFMLRNQKNFRMHILLLLQVNNILRRHNYYYFLHTKEQLIRCSLSLLDEKTQSVAMLRLG